jgi:NAD+ kinase
MGIPACFVSGCGILKGKDMNMERFTIIARPDPLSAQLTVRVETELRRHGFIRDDENPHTVIVIGGDGTFIYAVHQFIGRLNTVRFYGIHTGTLGFYTDYRDRDIGEFLDTLEKGGGWEETYPLLRCTVNGRDYFGINEVRIENPARTQVMDVILNGEKFETFRGTGMLVSTQLGSTAYNRSLGGAVIQEGLDLIELDEIAGIHHSKYRSLDAPLVLRADTQIEFVSDSFKGAVLGVDADVISLDEAVSVSVHTWKYCAVTMLRGRKVSYFDRLKTLF